MRRTTWVVAVGAALAVLGGPAVLAQAGDAAAAAKPANSQQEKMKSCNADAKTKGLKGTERKAFMKSCLSEHGTEAAPTAAHMNSQQEKMKTCNADAKAKSLKGDERKAFMKSCLSGNSTK